METGARARAGHRRRRGPQGAGGRRWYCQAATCCCASQAGCTVGIAGREVALDEQLGDGRAHGARVLDRHGSCGIVVEVDVVDPVIRGGVGGPLHDGADALAVCGDEPFVVAA